MTDDQIEQAVRWAAKAIRTESREFVAAVLRIRVEDGR